MIRVVADTNIIISAIFWSGKPLVIGDAQKELKGLIKQLRGDRKVFIKQLINDPDFEKTMLEKLAQRKTEREIVEMTMYHRPAESQKEPALQ